MRPRSCEPHAVWPCLGDGGRRPGRLLGPLGLRQAHQRPPFIESEDDVVATRAFCGGCRTLPIEDMVRRGFGNAFAPQARLQFPSDGHPPSLEVRRPPCVEPSAASGRRPGSRVISGSSLALRTPLSATSKHSSRLDPGSRLPNGGRSARPVRGRAGEVFRGNQPPRRRHSDGGPKLLNNCRRHICYCEGSDSRVVHFALSSYPIRRVRFGRRRYGPITGVDLTGDEGHPTIGDEMPPGRQYGLGGRRS